MWTAANRPRYKRDKLRYPSDLTDTEWLCVAPLIPPAKHGGRKRKVDCREIANGIMDPSPSHLPRPPVAGLKSLTAGKRTRARILFGAYAGNQNEERLAAVTAKPARAAGP